MTGASRVRGSPIVRDIGVDRAVDRGAVTVEAAIALCGFIAVLAMMLAGLSAVLAQIRCTDAPSEAARLASRGDLARARQAASDLAPSGATVTITGQDDTVVIEVADDPIGGLLPGMDVRARAVAVREPDPLDEPSRSPSTAETTGSPPTTTETPEETRLPTMLPTTSPTASSTTWMTSSPQTEGGRRRAGGDRR